MKHVLVAILVIACFVSWPSPARARFCILPELSDSFAKARAVFLGETIHIAEPKTLEEKAPFAERAYTIKFKVIRSWKGVPFAAAEFSILWLPNCPECLALPRLNEQYLVFANPVTDSETWSLVSSCNRTVGLSKDSNLTNDAIDPNRDMKQLANITKRVLAR